MAVQAWLPAWRTCWLHVRRADLTNERVLGKGANSQGNLPQCLFRYVVGVNQKRKCTELDGFTDVYSPQEWQCGGVPVTSLCVIERRKGKAQRLSDPHLWCETNHHNCHWTAIEQDKPVIRKALVEMTGDLHGSWVMENHFWSHSMFGSLRHFWGHNRSSSSRRSGTICEFVTCAP